MIIFECTLLINALAHVFNALATLLKTPAPVARAESGGGDSAVTVPRVSLEFSGEGLKSLQ